LNEGRALALLMRTKPYFALMALALFARAAARPRAASTAGGRDGRALTPGALRGAGGLREPQRALAVLEAHGFATLGDLAILDAEEQAELRNALPDGGVLLSERVNRSKFGGRFLKQRAP
jgi:hypothetical protein